MTAKSTDTLTVIDPNAAGLALLRQPFAPNQIGQLPKPYKADSPKGKCNTCGGWHGLPAAHLDYVGHAALTDRLLNADPGWTYTFMATDPNTGAPAFDANGGVWINLTVCGVTKPGYGDAQGKKGGNAVKEAIGDALRNAAMRFGAALDLWHKGDLHEVIETQGRTDSRASHPLPDAVNTDTVTRTTEQGARVEQESTATATTGPAGWRARIAACDTVDELMAVYQDAAAEGWASPDVMSALAARKQAVLQP